MIRPRIPALLLLAVLALTSPARAEDRGHDRDGPRAEEWEPEFEALGRQDDRILPLKRAAQIVQERFRGRLIAARLVPPTPQERDRGVVLVHQLRLLTPARDVLVVRLDAHSGDFLEVAGAGLTEARRKGPEP
ncbi:hypothetical protein [Paracoccus sp. TOH]|uniref:Membrane protein YkoI n=1 Tax=Paracoccus simplex TaxID=2086346 RepID=A0ABV7RU42_9RHOB|nr:hypothetical protein [Paracoccus sp. TOH]WJS85796.1 hypothetical protein NBE95_16750 [Paracoccus sp. TOH]